MKPAPQDRPLRVLLVVDSLDVGGAERHVADLALALAQRGHGVEVACSVSGALSEPLREAGVPVRPLIRRLAKRRVSFAYARGLRRLVTGRGFDLVHAHVYASAVAAALATVGAGMPLVITEHTEALWQDRRARAASGWASRRARRMIAVSSVIRERLVQRDGVAPGRITVIPNAVVPAADGRPGTPTELPPGLRGGPLVGIVARLQPEKGVANFVKAAARVASSVPDADFLVVGDGPLREELSALAGQLGVRGRVHFLGLRSDVKALMALMDVVAVPSLTEGAPLVTLEAMAAGVPVVASKVGGIPDQIRHHKEGLLVPPGDPGSLGDALVELLRDPGRAVSMGEAGRLRATSEFGHETMVSRVENVYRAALGLKVTSDAASEEPGLQTAR
jgi:glycosyltransferase involved in cell wall biosynthesis